MNKKIIKNIVSIILFNSWILFLWVSDIMVFDQILKAEYYWYVWPITIISHATSIIIWFVLGKCKEINKNIFVICTSTLALILLWFITLTFLDVRLINDLSSYIVSFIASFVPAVIVVCSIIILIKSVIYKITSSNNTSNDSRP